MATQTRYAKQPRTTERLFFREEEPTWEILSVHDRGRRIVVRDSINRERVLTRADKGWWLVAAASKED